MAKMSITFDGFKDLLDDINRAGGESIKAVDEALTKTQKIIQDNLQSAAAVYAHGGLKGYATGRMYKSIVKHGEVTWNGSVATVEAGFQLRGEGGTWDSIYVMYGTPRMKKDTKVYNAIKGAKTRAEIAKVQEETMKKYLKL